MTDAVVLQVERLVKQFDGALVLNEITLDIYDQEFLTLLGPSGCGKTTLLRTIAGFETPTRGDIRMAGQSITALPPQAREVHTVFQSYALFPHMTVYDNVAFALTCRKQAKTQIREQVLAALAHVHLTEHAHKKPAQLSGGQQQRVAIARAIVDKPKILLLDEPLSALDYRLRKTMQVALKQLQRELGMTFIYVTHDQEEALSMSDRIVVMQEGRIAQVGTPRDIYETPKRLSIAKFIGELNIFDSVVEAVDTASMQVSFAERQFTLNMTAEFEVDQAIHILIRPEDMRVWRERDVENKMQAVPAVIREMIYKGSTVDFILELHSGQRVLATEFFNEDDEDLTYALGESVWLTWIPGWEVVLPHESA